MCKIWSISFCESVLLNILNLRNEEIILKAKLCAIIYHCCFEMVLLVEIRGAPAAFTGVPSLRLKERVSV